MCIIAYKPAGVDISKKTLKTCYKNNPDGAGFMFPCEGNVLIRKGYFSFSDFWAAWEKTQKIHGDSVPVVFHFRISTAGKIDKVNCHPHRIKEDLAFVHNGILGIDVPKKSAVSDTIIYRDCFLRDMTADSLRESTLFHLMGDHIGDYNKFLFLNGRGEVAFANEDRGVWDNGVWFSNATYKVKTYKAVTSTFYDYYAGNYNFCEYCGKDLDTPEERADGLCYDCANYGDYGECETCGRSLVDPAHHLAGWCDDCGEAIYGKTEWQAFIDECEIEAATLVDTRGSDYGQQVI